MHGGQEWEAMQREIKKKNMYQAASFTGDLGEADGFWLALLARDHPNGRVGSRWWLCKRSPPNRTQPSSFPISLTTSHSQTCANPLTAVAASTRSPAVPFPNLSLSAVPLRVATPFQVFSRRKSPPTVKTFRTLGIAVTQSSKSASTGYTEDASPSTSGVEMRTRVTVSPSRRTRTVLPLVAGSAALLCDGQGSKCER